MQKSNRLILVTITVLLMALILSACNAAPATTKPTNTTPIQPSTTKPAPASTPAQQPQYGGTLKIIAIAGPTNLGDPRQVINVPGLFCTVPAIENLFRYDEKGDIVPWLVTNWQNSADLKTITLTLRKGVKFHDGTDFNAQAEKELLDMIKPNLAELKAVTSVDIVDDYTIKLNLSKPQPGLLSSLASAQAGWVVSPTALKTQTKEWLLANPVGTGPFKIASFKRDVSIRYEKFDGYWQKGKPYLDAVEFNIMADPTVALMSFQAGEAQVLSEVTKKNGFDIQQAKQFRVGKVPSAIFTIAGDSANPKSPFADIKVRMAVSYAIDTATIVRTQGYGFWDVTNQVFNPIVSAYNPATVGYPYNPDKAKQLLNEAGYASGIQTTLTYKSSTDTELYTAVQSYLNAVGINVKLALISQASYMDILTKGWEGLIDAQRIGVGPDLGAMLENLWSSKGTYNVSVMHPAELDAKIAQANSEIDPAKRVLELQEASKMIIDQYCLTSPICATAFTGVWDPKLHDAKIREFWVNQWIPEDAWLSK
jgi:peptide/nickel transport system substrate-binding protein